ncbi:MAG: trimethylamine methyltransferase, partial [Rhodospirillaceae bacterium]|nr:trimethylamine methyltransferase [Rhodospirillaceae bacterium]
MARRARAARQRSAAARGAPASPFIRRRLPAFEVLDEEQLRRIETQVDWIVQDVGIAFRGDPEALQLWREAGATVDDDLVRAPADWVRAMCAKAPRQFTQRARNPDRSVVIGGDNQVYAAVYGPPFVRDLEGGRRYGDLESFRNLVKLIYMHPHLHHGSFVVCEPCDIPVSIRHLDMLHAHMTLSDKPHFGAITEKSRAQDSVDMAEIVFGRETMDEHCVILGNVNTNSPLLVDKVVTEAIRAYC